MSNVDLIKSITNAFMGNRADTAVLDASFAPNFQYWTNGVRGDLKAYTASLDAYMKDYDGFTIPSWDELFGADDKVVVAYTLNGKKRGGGSDSMYVMAVWQVKAGKVVSLRQVFARP